MQDRGILRPGLYEEIISDLLDSQLNHLEGLRIEKDELDSAEGPSLLSNYLANVFMEALNVGAGDISDKIAFTNSIIDLIREKTHNKNFPDFRIHIDGQILMSIANMINTAHHVDSTAKPVRPITSLSQSSLFTGAGISGEPQLASELRKEIESSDRIDLLVSFIKWRGIRILSEQLERFTAREGTQLRIITTSYMRATDFKAVEYLSNLRNTQIKVSYDTERTRLHAKAYMFHRETGFTTAYIGSSNISNTALTDGLEWNMKITAKDSPHILKKCLATFDACWENKEFVLFDNSEVSRTRLRVALAPEKEISSNKIFFFDIEPRTYQSEILEKLDAERTLHGRFRNLVVAATGTGKTVVSAFDYRRIRDGMQGQPCRLLYVAHRKEILEQSLGCFRSVLRDQNFGELLVDGNVPTFIDHLFISIQSLNSKDFISGTSKDFYDYIIVDEFHHGAAASYQKLLEYYTPKVLLGLTATPERADGQDILHYFDNHIAAEIRLYEALNQKLLTPFQYFGVTDSASHADAWQGGQYDRKLLTRKFIDNADRTDAIVKAIYRYCLDVSNLICVAFCVSVEHAQYMEAEFLGRGLRAASLTGETHGEIRDEVKKRLVSKEINFLFVVDIYNEGVDIPEIDTILFLRPTESLTIFLQQLGRGLRLHRDKDCLTVLDFIGQAHKNYSYENKFSALVSKSAHSMVKEVSLGFPHLPAGCVIELEKVAQNHVLKNIQDSINNSKTRIVNRIQSFTDDTGKQLTFPNFITHYNLSPNDIYSRGLWSRLLVEAGIKDEFTEPDEIRLTRGIQRIQHANSIAFIDSSLAFLTNRRVPNDERLLLMLYYNLWSESGPKRGFETIFDAFEQLERNPICKEELIELLRFNRDQLNYLNEHIEVPGDAPLDLYGKYTQDEILTALGYFTFDHKIPHQAGVLFLPELKTDIFLITLNKSEKDYSPSTLYDDYAISEEYFHWQSQGATSDTSTTGRRYINHLEKGTSILLMVRENKKENGMGAPYYFLGPATYVEHRGSRPMSITWKMKHKIPAHLLSRMAKLAI